MRTCTLNSFSIVVEAVMNRGKWLGSFKIFGGRGHHACIFGYAVARCIIYVGHDECKEMRGSSKGLLLRACYCGYEIINETIVGVGCGAGRGYWYTSIYVYTVRRKMFRVGSHCYDFAMK